ncbi:MAG TPA: AbrB/MazE/SpoVT family DNA-binding domain-containing protein [Thermomicrobiales bacterium]|nr:AbrB/MazE/SpoVT family DNA-binding domain-containing protein [Thermomicrobiales bacterium]
MSEFITRVSAKGQVVIPKTIRDQKNLDVGDLVTLVSEDDRVRVDKRSGWARATAGCLPSSIPPLEPDALDDIIEQTTLQELREKYGTTG